MQALDLQTVVVGPAQGDDEGARRHRAGLWYYAAAIVVHAECLDFMDDDQIEQLASELVMVPSPSAFPEQPSLAKANRSTDPGSDAGRAAAAS